MGFLNYIRAISGTCITVLPLAAWSISTERATFLLLLQGIVDQQGQFTYVTTRQLNKVHGTMIFRNFSLVSLTMEEFASGVTTIEMERITIPHVTLSPCYLGTWCMSSPMAHEALHWDAKKEVLSYYPCN